MQNFWKAVATAYEKQNGESFPKCLRFLMEKAGYNSSPRLKNMDENRVSSIETFFDASKQILNKLCGRDSLTYKRMQTFKFLPGHREIILSIPEILPEVEASTQRAIPKSKSKAVDKCSKEKKVVTEIGLKEKLLKGLKNVAKKMKFDNFMNILTDANIVEFQKIVGHCKCGKECNTIFKCTFVCPVCPKRYKLQYKEFWMSSNVTKHIKQHIKDQVQA